MADKAVVLLSGGMDSAVAAARARALGRSLVSLTFDYGQSHREELRRARVQARLLGVERAVSLRLPLGRVASGALLEPSRIGTRGPRPGRPATYVNFRNGIFLAAAAALAESVGAREVWGGWCRTDHAGYPDCTPAFFRAFERAVRAGTWDGRRGRPFRVVAPLAGMDKAASVRLGLRLGVDFGRTWTCYRPASRSGGAGEPCGACDACRLRAEGFRRAGVADPLRP